MNRLVSVLMSVLLAASLAPVEAFAQVGGVRNAAADMSGLDLGEASDSGEVAAVKAAADAAVAYSREQEFAATALKDVFEMELPGALCYSVGDGDYHVLYGAGYYAFTVGDEGAVAAGAVGEDDQLAVYGTLGDARAALADAPASTPDAFVTRGMSVVGDGGHGRYVKAAALGSGQPGIIIGADAYALASVESAVNPYQLGYADDPDDPANSVNAAIDAFHASGFHTLVFPQGEYRLAKDVYSRYDDRAYYGLDATLFTDGAVALRERNAAHRSLWVVRGDIGWAKGDAYVNGKGEFKKKDIYHHVSNVELNGLTLERRTGTSGYNRMVSVRSARGVTFNRCTIDGVTADDAMPASGSATATCGAIFDLYGDYDDVSFLNGAIRGEDGIEIRDLCDHVDNIPASMQVASDYPTGGRHVVVRGSDITTYNFDEGLPIFAGNEQGLGTWKDGVFTEYATLTHCLVEDVLVEDNRYTMLEPQTKKQRVVAITCGYQDSPVRNAVIRNNTFDVCANDYLIMFGYAENCRFAGNDIALRRTTTASKIHELVHRSDHSRTGPASGLSVEGNTIAVAEEDATVSRMVGTSLGPEALSFTGNDVTVEGTVERVFDSTAVQAGNTFHLNYVKHLYDRVGEVANNAYYIDRLESIYESYGTDAKADLYIHDERAEIGTLGREYLFTFNGSPRYNGHTITVADCSYAAAESKGKLRVAYSTAGIVDGVALRLVGDGAGMFGGNVGGIVRDGEGKVALAVAEKAFGSVADLRADAGLAADDVAVTKAYYEGGANGISTAGAGVYDIEQHDGWGEAEDDGGLRIRLGDGLWALLRTPADTVDLYQFGAHGDGTTDDSAHVKAALHSGAATVRVSAGTYQVEGVSIPSNTAVIGASRDECSFVPPVDSNGYGNPVDGFCGLEAAASDVVVRNVTFDGRRDVYRKAGIALSDPVPDWPEAAHELFEDLGLKHFTLFGWLYGATNLSIDGCRFMNNNHEAIQFAGGKDIAVTDCEFLDVDCGFISQGGGERGDVTNARVDGCTFDGHWFSEPISMFAEGSHYEKLAFTNNTFKNKPAGSAILLFANDTSQQNTFHDVTISGNKMERCSGGLSIWNVTDGTFSDNDLGDSKISLNDCTDVTVSDASFADVPQSPLLMRGCTNVKVSGLDVDGFGSAFGESGRFVFPAISVGSNIPGGQNEGCSIAGTVRSKFTSTDDNRQPGVIASVGGVDLSGLTFDMPGISCALFVNEGVTGLTFHSGQDVLVYDGSGTRGNDIIVDATAEVTADPSSPDGGATFTDARVSAAFERYCTTWHVAWRNWASGTGLAYMDPCQDGFVRTLTVAVPPEGESPDTEGVLKDGDGSEGSIFWFGGGHAIAKGDSATYTLVCQGGIWREFGYAWADDLGAVSVIRASGEGGAAPAAETVATTAKVTKAATCDEKGETTYTATFSNPAFEVQSRTVADVPALGHSWDGGRVTKKPTVSAKGVRTYTCKRCGTKKTASVAKLIDLSKAKVALSKSSYAYNGAARKPSVTVKLADKKVAAKDYSIAYAKGRKAVGSYRVTVKGKGIYGGSRSATFKVVPKATVLASVKAARRGFTARWSKVATQASGYQVQYGPKKSFKQAKARTVASPKTTSLKVAKLKPNKRYYVRVRVYKKVGKAKYYSAWSKAKPVKTKR